MLDIVLISAILLSYLKNKFSLVVVRNSSFPLFIYLKQNIVNGRPRSNCVNIPAICD